MISITKGQSLFASHLYKNVIKFISGLEIGRIEIQAWFDLVRKQGYFSFKNNY